MATKKITAMNKVTPDLTIQGTGTTNEVLPNLYPDYNEILGVKPQVAPTGNPYFTGTAGTSVTNAQGETTKGGTTEKPVDYLGTITTPSGKTFDKQTPEDVAYWDAKTAAATAHASPYQKAAALQEQQQQNQALLASGQAGQINPQTLSNIEATPTPIDWGQAIGAGTIGNLGNIASTAGTVGLAGFAGTAANPVGAIGGAIVGGVASIISGVSANIKQQQADNLAVSKLTLSESTSTMNNLISLMNADPANSAEYYSQFMTQMSLTQESYSQLKADTDQDLNKWLGNDGTTQLKRYALFYAQGGERQMLMQKMQEAMLTPNPAKVNYQSLMMSSSSIGETA